MNEEYATTTHPNCRADRQAGVRRKSPPTSEPRRTVTLPPSSIALISRRRDEAFGSISSGEQLPKLARAL